MAYYLYFASIDDVKRYHRFLQMDKEKQHREKKYIDVCHPLKFQINEKCRDSFKIEEIDSLTCGYKNEQELINQIKSKNISYLTNEECNSNHLNLVHLVRGQVKQDMPLYDNLLLFEQAINLRQKKKNSEGQKVLTDYTERLDDFIKYLLCLAKNKTTSNFLMNPKNISYLTKEEQQLLDMDVLKGSTKIEINPIDGSNTTAIVKPGLRNLLADYLRYSSLYTDLYNRQESSLEIEQNLRQTTQSIHLFFQKDYQNLRKMMEWEIRYVQILENVLQRENLSQKEKDIIRFQIEKVKEEQQARNNQQERSPIHDEDEEQIYELYHPQEKLSDRYFENEKIQRLYEHGGIEQVMEQMDLDDLLLYSSDAQKLGILPSKKNK